MTSPDPSLVGPDIASLAPYRAGPPWQAQAKSLGIEERDMVLLAANENALGPSPLGIAAAQRALQESSLYPDSGATVLKRVIAERFDVPEEHLVIGNGSNELIELLVRTFVGPGETVVTAWPSFVPYRLAAHAAGREVLLAPLMNDRYDLAALAALVDQRTKLVFIANPNNPTGTYVPKRMLTAFLDRIPRSVIVVLDEAYLEFARAEDCPDGLRDFRAYPRLVVLRTFSKAYGLAGLRVGFGVMDPSLVHYLDCVRQPFNVNAIALAAATAALGDEEHLLHSRRMVAEGMTELERGLIGLGASVVQSQASFVLARFKRTGPELSAALAARGILVRDMAGYDMPEALRITVGTTAMNRSLLGALEEICG